MITEASNLIFLKGVILLNKQPQLSVPIIFQKLKQYDANDTRFLQVKIWLMHLGENLNGSYFSKEVVENAIPSLANTPILAYIEDNSDGEKDFSDHRMVLIKEDGQYKIKYIGQAIGVIPETNNAKFEMRVCDDGVEREFLTVEGLLWTKFDDPIDIMNRDKIKAQSMELAEDYEGEWKEDNLFHFTKFKFYGACALGADVLPAMRSASIEVNFSCEDFIREIQEKVEQFKAFANKEFIKKEDIGTGEKIDIDLSEDAADYDTPWGNVDKTKLRNDILKAKNYKTLVKKCYLIVEDGWEDVPSQHLKYPVCMIKDNTLVLSANGCKAALSYLEKNTDDPNYSSAKSKLKKYYKVLGLDTSNFNKNHSADKGGNKVDEKLELLQKYNLTVEDLSFSIDDLSLEELESKIMEFVDLQKNNNISFSATYVQKREALQNALEPIIVKDDEGNIVEETYFWVADFDDNYVYVEKSYWSLDNHERTYGRFTYTFDESTITATITGEFEKMVLVWLTEEENQRIQNERENAVAEYEKLKNEFEKYKQQYSTPNEEVLRLKEFEKNTLAEKRKHEEEFIFAQFDEKLKGNEEYEVLKASASNYTIEELSEKCFAILGKKNANFSLNKKDKSTIKIPIPKANNEYKPYGNLFEMYLKTNN